MILCTVIRSVDVTVATVAGCILAGCIVAGSFPARRHDNPKSRASQELDQLCQAIHESCQPGVIPALAELSPGQPIPASQPIESR